MTSITNISFERSDFSSSQKVKKIVELYLVYLFASLVLSIPLQITDKLIVKQFFDFSFYHQVEVNTLKIANRFGGYGLLYVILLGPFFEELIFRLPLSLEKRSIGVCFAVTSYWLLINHRIYEVEYDNPYWYLKLSIALSVFILTVKFFPNSWLTTIKINFLQHTIYFTSSVFALLHITNFAPYNAHVIFFYPVFVLPQFLMGLFLGYARIKYGFLYGVALHGLINLPFALLHL
jgi:hypothetical protein